MHCPRPLNEEHLLVDCGTAPPKEIQKTHLEPKTNSTRRERRSTQRLRWQPFTEQAHAHGLKSVSTTQARSQVRQLQRRKPPTAIPIIHRGPGACTKNHVFLHMESSNSQRRGPTRDDEEIVPRRSAPAISRPEMSQQQRSRLQAGPVSLLRRSKSSRWQGLNATGA